MRGTSEICVCDLPRVPRRFETLFGDEVLTRHQSWRIRKNQDGRGYVVFRIDRLSNPIDQSKPAQKNRARAVRRSAFSARLQHAIVLFLVEYLAVTQPLSCGSSGLLGAFTNFERYLFQFHKWGRGARRFDIVDLTAEIFESYRRHTRDVTPSNGRYGSFLTNFYQWGVSSGFLGFSQAVLRSMRSAPWSISQKGNVSRSRNPIKDALVWEEHKQLCDAVSLGLGDPRDRAVVAFIHETGIRPEALVRIRAATLAATAHPERWKVDVPRVKNQGRRREPLKTYFISRELGELLESLHRSEPEPTAFLFNWLTDAGPTGQLRRSFLRFSEESNLRTARIIDSHGEPSRLRLTPIRLRRRLATDMAERGADMATIAEALDDRSLAMAAVYAATTSTIVDILADTLDRHPAWFTIVNLFKGITSAVPSKAHPAILGGLSHLAGFDKAHDIGPIGWCALEGACELLPPLSCYSCPHMIATTNEKVHERQLEQLKAEAAECVGLESDVVVSALFGDMAAILVLIARLRVETGRMPGILPIHNPLRSIKETTVAFG